MARRTDTLTVEEVQARFEDWRRKRQGRTVIPTGCGRQQPIGAPACYRRAGALLTNANCSVQSRAERKLSLPHPNR